MTSAFQTPAEAGGLQDLQARLAQLHDAGAAGFDPVRMRQLDILLQQARQKTGPVAGELQQRIAGHLQRLQAEFEQAGRQARLQARMLVQQQPERNETLIQLFKAGQFRAIDRMVRQVMPESLPSRPLQSLLHQLATQEPQLDSQLDPDTFDEILRKQELAVHPGDGLTSLDTHLRTRLDKDELRSARRFRDHWAKQAIDRAIARALDEAPENAGPLNAHLLVIRTLNTLSDIAPAYLNRFVSWIDSLLWLEQGAPAPAPDSKPPDTKLRSRKTGSV